MRDIKKPEFMLEALRGRRGFIAILEILIAFVVFLVSTIAMGIIEVPLLMGYMLSDDEFMSIVSDMANGQMDTTTYYAKVQSMALNIPEWLKICILLLEILMIIVILLYCRFLEKRKLRTMGFRKKNMISQYLLGALGGILFFSVAYLICIVTGGIRFKGFSDNIAPIYIVGYFAGYMIQGMAEEVLCRGYLFVSLSRRNSVVYSAVLSALVFSVLHGSNSGVSLLALLNIFLFGIFAALMLVYFENIWIVGAFHSFWNFAQGNLYGIQVSGNALQPSFFVSENHSGMAFINGGNFGVEGGLGVTVVFVLGIAVLLYLLNQQGKLAEWKGLRPKTNEYNNYVLRPNVAPNYGNGNPQNPNGQYGNGYPQAPNEQYGNGYPQAPNRQYADGNLQTPNQTVPTQPVRTENMGTEPGETPWHPDNEPQEPENQFDANYFKE
ncbi:MAG: CPBP family intramembrane metalloprotease [Lachnospiraceae bacterium]|nr:CPBP family intramembrane metalloprotease [Lachnospiraceae bacterium]